MILGMSMTATGSPTAAEKMALFNLIVVQTRMDATAIKDFSIVVKDDARHQRARRNLLSVIWDVSITISVSLSETEASSADTLAASVVGTLASDSFEEALNVAPGLDVVETIDKDSITLLDVFYEFLVFFFLF